jgi:hypothetical protein
MNRRGLKFWITFSFIYPTSYHNILKLYFTSEDYIFKFKSNIATLMIFQTKKFILLLNESINSFLSSKQK